MNDKGHLAGAGAVVAPIFIGLLVVVLEAQVRD